MNTVGFRPVRAESTCLMLVRGATRTSTPHFGIGYLGLCNAVCARKSAEYFSSPHFAPRRRCAPPRWQPQPATSRQSKSPSYAPTAHENPTPSAASSDRSGRRIATATMMLQRRRRPRSRLRCNIEPRGPDRRHHHLTEAMTSHSCARTSGPTVARPDPHRLGDRKRGRAECTLDTRDDRQRGSRLRRSSFVMFKASCNDRFGLAADVRFRH
jgi:hypothetical protein